MKCFVQLVSQCHLHKRCHITKQVNMWLYGCHVSCNLSRFDDHMRLKEHFHWLVLHTVAIQVAGQMLHRAMLKKFVAAVAESRTQFYFPQTVSATCLATLLAVARYVRFGNDSCNLSRKSQEKLHSVTAPLTAELTSYVLTWIRFPRGFVSVFW